MTSDAGFQDSDCLNGIEILRPLKEFSLEEILLYNDGDLNIGMTNVLFTNKTSK